MWWWSSQKICRTAWRSFCLCWELVQSSSLSWNRMTPVDHLPVILSSFSASLLSHWSHVLTLLVCLTSALRVVMCPFPHLCKLLFFSMRNLQNIIHRQSYKCFSVCETFGTVYSQQRILNLLIEYNVLIGIPTFCPKQCTVCDKLFLKLPNNISMWVYFLCLVRDQLFTRKLCTLV